MESATPLLGALPDLRTWSTEHWVSFGLLWLVLFAIAGFVAKIWRRAAGTLEDTIFSNWRLALLGATGVILSLASGWTTWDGMRNFTGEPALSFMITFGIQGVMLIVAWLIGESFATGMSMRSAGGSGGWDLIVTSLFAVLAVIAAMIWFGQGRADQAFDASNWFNSQAARTVKNFALFGAITALVMAFVIAATKSDVGANYVQSARLIIKNAVLWIMFLACMGTSVFFSFDSLFSTIFPAQERKRAAEIRATNQVSAVVADIGGLVTTRRIEAARELFNAPAWSEYEGELDKAIALAKSAPGKIREQMTRELEEQRSRLAKLEEQRASASGGQAGLQVRKTQLTDELSRIQAERPSAVAEANTQKAVVAEVEKRLDEQRTKVLAEEKGVEGSLKVGRGQFWRAAKVEEDKVRAELQIARERLRSPQSRVETIDRRISQIRGELAQIDGDLAKLRGEADTASQMIEVAKAGNAAINTQKFDPSAGVAGLDRERQTFRQNPERETLIAIQQSCSALVGASLKVDTLRDQAAGIDCDPKRASEAAARVFALNEGLKAFAQNCAGGEHLPTTGGTDALLEFGRRCLQDSALSSQDSAAMGQALARIDLNRDDKAHRFVVTWNAFQDGNRLAYLALAIAIAIDSLVFMSGLFGANAVRSPLSDVPSLKARSAQQLEAIIENALLPDTFTNADAVLTAMQPITPIDGFTQEVIIPLDEAVHRDRVIKVLNAAATIGAVHRDVTRPERYLVRPELFEFLSAVAKRSFESNKDHVRNAELRQILTVALRPDVGRNADIVLNNMEPINEAHGFSSQIRLGSVPATEVSVVRRVLNAGATVKYVQRAERHDTKNPEHDLYFVHGQLYKTIALICAHSPRPPAASLQQPGLSAPEQSGVIEGGALGRPRGALPPQRAERTIAPPPRAQLTQQVPLTQEEQERWASIVTDQLLAAVGLNEAVVDARFSREGVKDTAYSAWRELHRHAQLNLELQQLLRQHQTEQDRELSRMLDKLQLAAGGDQRKLDILERIDNDIRTALPALMLFPETGLVRNLIEALEEAAAPDDGQQPGEDILLGQLREVSELMSHCDLGDVDSWARIRETLADSRIVEFRQRRRGQSGGNKG